MKSLKRTVLILLVLLLAAAGLSACGKAAYTPVDETPGTLQISAEFVGNGTVKLTNHDTELWGFGEYYSLEVFRNGTWYYQPLKHDLVVHDLGHELAPGQSQTMTYDLTPYGKLSPGRYRIACGGLGDSTNWYYAEFELLKNGDCVPVD